MLCFFFLLKWSPSVKHAEHQASKSMPVDGPEQIQGLDEEEEEEENEDENDWEEDEELMEEDQEQESKELQ
jgi:hypothetical protein